MITADRYNKWYIPEPITDLSYFIESTDTTRKTTIGQYLEMYQPTLNIPCQYCGSRGKYDRRGNCGACGAPVEVK
jgi:hypothetical protein